MSELSRIKRFQTLQIQQIRNILLLDEAQKIVEKKMDAKQKTQLMTDLETLQKDRDDIARKIQRIKVESLILQAKRSIEEYREPNNAIEKIINETRKKPISLASLPPTYTRKKRKKKQADY